MCGRYVQTSTVQTLRAALRLPGAAEAGGNQIPHYNVSPRMYPWIGLYDDRAGGRLGARQLVGAQWGLLPHWAHDADATRPINARAETVFELPTFRRVILRRRCLVAADGWYEWRTVAGKKVPYYFSLKNDEPFFFGGVWDRWGKPGERGEVQSFAIITTAANATVARIHDRMPLIIPPDAYDRWLDPLVTDRAVIEPLLAPYPAELVRAHRVSQAVNSSRNDGPDLIKPVPDEDD